MSQFVPRQPISGRVIKLSAIGAAIGIAVIILNPFHQVPTGHRGVVTQFGRIVGIEGEGLAVLPPWQKLNIFNVRAEQADIDKADGATSDTQPVTVSMTVRYAVAPDRVAEVFEKYSKTGDLTSYMQTAAADTLKAVTAKYTAPELISKRVQVAADIKNTLQEKVRQYGALVLNVDMRNFEFGRDYMAAINEKVTQEQKRQAAENRLRTVEAEQKQKVAIAEAEANAAKAAAEGQAAAQLKMAQAEAEALRIKNNAIRDSKDILELERIKVEQIKWGRWNGQPPHSITNWGGNSAPVPIMNIK